jgi:protein-disulfide isomerase
MTKEAKIIVFFTLLVFVGIGALIAFTSSDPQSPGDPTVLVRDDSHMTGKKDAQVTLVEFGDFQCPACAAAFPIIEKLKLDYKDNPNFNFVYRHFPLTMHQHAPLAAQAAEAAGKQGKFWEMYSTLFSKQNAWALASNAEPLFVQYATDLNLDINKFKDDLTSDAVEDFVRDDTRDGNAVGVSSTPTFFINGERAVGVPNYEGLKAKIDVLLQ